MWWCGDRGPHHRLYRCVASSHRRIMETYAAITARSQEASGYFSRTVPTSLYVCQTHRGLWPIVHLSPVATVGLWSNITKSYFGHSVVVFFSFKSITVGVCKCETIIVVCLSVYTLTSITQMPVYTVFEIVSVQTIAGHSNISNRWAVVCLSCLIRLITLSQASKSLFCATGQHHYNRKNNSPCLTVRVNLF